VSLARWLSHGFPSLRGLVCGLSSANEATLLQGGDVPPPRGQPGVEHRGSAGPLSALVSVAFTAARLTWLLRSQRSLFLGQFPLLPVVIFRTMASGQTQKIPTRVMRGRPR
jgi:hypothetical protein